MAKSSCSVQPQRALTAPPSPGVPPEQGKLSCSPWWGHPHVRPLLLCTNYLYTPQSQIPRHGQPPTAPEHPLLFLHPGDGFGPLALPATPGRALFLGSDGLGADRGRALEEGLHGCAGPCRAVSGLSRSRQPQTPQTPQAPPALPANSPAQGGVATSARRHPIAERGGTALEGAGADVMLRALLNLRGGRGGAARGGRGAGGASGRPRAPPHERASPQRPRASPLMRLPAKAPECEMNKKRPLESDRCTRAREEGPLCAVGPAAVLR